MQSNRQNTLMNCRDAVEKNPIGNTSVADWRRDTWIYVCRRHSVSWGISQLEVLLYGSCKKNLWVAAKEARSTGVHLLNTLVIEPNLDPRMGPEWGRLLWRSITLISRIAWEYYKNNARLWISGKENVVHPLLISQDRIPQWVELERGAVEVSEREIKGSALTYLGCLY